MSDSKPVHERAAPNDGHDRQAQPPPSETESGPPSAEAAPSEAPSPAASEARTPEPRLDELQRQCDEYLDQLQRTRAEFSNYQKRARAQADAERPYAVGPLAHDLLSVLDNLERAAEAARAAEVPALIEGIEMVRKQLLDVLAQHGVEPIDALGQPFDPMLHEALIQQPNADHPEGTVVAELGKGYRFHDRVLRPSRVAVSIRPPSSDDQPGL